MYTTGIGYSSNVTQDPSKATHFLVDFKPLFAVHERLCQDAGISREQKNVESKMVKEIIESCITRTVADAPIEIYVVDDILESHVHSGELNPFDKDFLKLRHRLLAVEQYANVDMMRFEDEPFLPTEFYYFDGWLGSTIALIGKF